MKILVVQTAFLGDIILSTPVFRGIRRLYADSKIWVLTTPKGAELLKRDPDIQAVISFDKRGNDSGLQGIIRKATELRSMKFDVVYSLHRSARTALMLWLSRIPLRIGFADSALSLLYHKCVRRDMQLHNVLRNYSILGPASQAAYESAELRLFAPAPNELSEKCSEQLQNISSYVVLVPGSRWNTKMWSWQGYREVAKFFLRAGYKVVILGSAGEEGLAGKIAHAMDTINLVGNTTVSDSLFVIKNAGLVVCNDSMALHVASAFKVPTVAIFCATSPSFGFGPWGNPHVIVEKNGLVCKPCSPHGGDRCPTGTRSCMDDLSPDEVIQAAQSLLNDKMQESVQP